MVINMLKRVKHLTNEYIKGQDYDLPEVLAADWVVSGYASLRGEEEEAPKVKIAKKGAPK
jgi:hypothetical protein